MERFDDVKSPAFQFYATDWLGSQRVQMMTLQEEGAYIRLVAYCWQHGDIPRDPEEAARLIGKGASTTLAEKVLSMFIPAQQRGRLTHDRLEAQKLKQAAWREKSAAGGRKSAEMRSKGGSTVVQPPYQPEGNIPYSVLRTPKVPPNPQGGNGEESGNGTPEKAWNPSPVQLRLGSLFSRKPTTRWSPNELKAWKKIGSVEEGDLELLERYYTAKLPETKDYRRHDLSTLLNNFAGELDRARKFKEPSLW